MLALVGIACGEASVVVDASTDANPDLLARDAALPEIAAPAAPEQPAPAAAPAAPVSTPCPAGWRLVDGVCDPWPEGATLDCTALEAPFLGEGCGPIGSSCPEDGWPADLPIDQPVLYVRAGADPGLADGSRDLPYASIGAAHSAASDGDLVAIARGSYDEAIVIRKALTLIGACASETVVAPSSADEDWAAIHLVGTARLGLREVTVRAPARLGIKLEGGTEADVRNVHVARSHGVGVFVMDGARLVASQIVVEDVALHPSWNIANGFGIGNGAYAEIDRFAVRGAMRSAISLLDARAIFRNGSVRRLEPYDGWEWKSYAIFAGGSAELTLERSAVEDAGWTAIRAERDGLISLTDVIVRDTPPAPNGSGGEGLVADAARIVGSRVLLERNRMAAATSMSGGSVTLSDSIVRETRRQLVDGQGGFGASTAGGALALERCLLESNIAAGVWGWGRGSAIVLRDVVVRGTRPRAGAEDGFGIFVAAGARLTAERVELVDNRSGALMVEDAGDATVAEISDFIARDSEPSRGIEANGINVIGRARLNGARVLLDNNSGNGLKLWGGGTAIVEDLVVRNTRPNALLWGGTGVWVTRGSTFSVSRALLDTNRSAGVAVDSDHPNDPSIRSSATLADIVVRNTRSDDLIGINGNALRASGGVTLSVLRAVLEDNHELAVAAQDPGTRVDLADIVIARTQPRECVDRDLDACASSVSGGCGAAAFNGGFMELTRFAITESALCGIMVAQDGTIALHEGRVSQNPIGANVQVIDYDLELLSDRVRYIDNERNYDGTRLAVPDATIPVFGP